MIDIKEHMEVLGIPLELYNKVDYLVRAAMTEAAECAYKIGYADRGKGNAVPNIINHLKEHEVL